MEHIIVGGDIYVLPVAERLAKEALDVPAYERQQRTPPSARASRGGAERYPAQPEDRNTSATMSNQRTGGASAEGFLGRMETMPDVRQTSPTTQPQEPTAVKRLSPGTVWGPTTDCDVDRTSGERSKIIYSTCTESATQGGGVFWSSELNTQGMRIGETDCGGIDAEDWLDVTNAMMGIGRSGFDFE